MNFCLIFVEKIRKRVKYFLFSPKRPIFAPKELSTKKMIRDFWVKNYLSIRDRQELSFEAKGPASELVVEISKGVFLYKLGILYGSNASGKSNMLVALNEVFRLLVSPKSDAKQEIEGFLPFALTPRILRKCMSLSTPTVSGTTIVSVSIESVFLHEVLNYYPNGSKALFYERSFVGESIQADIKFGASLKLLAKTQESIRENTLNNHSVLSVCRKAALKEDIGPFASLHRRVMTNYHDVDGDIEKGLVEILSEAYEDHKKRKFFTQMLQKADLNIMAYRPVIEDRFVPQEYRERVSKASIPRKCERRTAEAHQQLRGLLEPYGSWRFRGCYGVSVQGYAEICAHP